MPHRLPHFAGRREELDRLQALLADPDRSGDSTTIVAITGTAGVGKTTLALHWGHQIRSSYPDGQLYVNLRGFDPGSALDPAEATRGFLDALGVPPQAIPQGLPAQAAMYRSLLATSRMLVVLDNARDVDQVLPLLPGSPGALVVVTSRNDLAGLVMQAGAHPVNLELMSVDEARALLARRIGAGRVAEEPDAVADIVASCARLPLALAIVAARAALHPRFRLADLAAQLKSARVDLDVFDVGETSGDVRAVLSWSYQELAELPARVFRLLGLLHASDISTPAVASLAGIALPEARRALRELCRAHLVEEHLPGRFTSHDLLRAYAAELSETCDADEVRSAAVRRLVAHCLHSATAADRWLNPYRGDSIALEPAPVGVVPESPSSHAAALAWLVAERPTLLATLGQCVESGLDRETWQLAWALSPFLEYQGHWRDWAGSQHVAVEAARRTGETRNQALSSQLLGRAYIRMCRYDEAQIHLENALALYEAVGNDAGRAQSHRDLAWRLDRQERHDAGLVEARQALRLFEAAGDRLGQGRALNAVGWFHVKLGDVAESLPYLQEALDLQVELGDRFGQAETLDSLGCAYSQLGRHAAAIAAYERALEIYRDFGDVYDEADTLASLGDALFAAGDLDTARIDWERSLTLLQDLHHPDGTAVRDKLRNLWQRDRHRRVRHPAPSRDEAEVPAGITPSVELPPR